MHACATRLRIRLFLLAMAATALLFAFALPLRLMAWGPCAWSTPLNVSDSDVDSHRPAIRLDKAGNIHVVWHDQVLGSAESDVYYARRSPMGGWSEPQPLSSLGGEASFPAVALGCDDTLHVVWQDSSSGESEIHYLRKPSGGAWTPVRNISSTDGGSRYPRIAVAGDGKVHVIWQEWAAGVHSDIYHTCQYSDSPWTTPYNLSQSDGDSDRAVLSVDVQGTVHVCWQDLVSGGWEIYYACQSPGVAWITPQNISGSEGDSQDAAIVSSDLGALHVVWSESTVGVDPGDSDVLYASRSSTGVWAPTIKNVSNRPGRSDNPVIAADVQGGIHVAWQDVNPPGFWDVYSASRDPGAGWSDPLLVSTFDGNAERPAILAGQEVDVLWAGGVEGNWEICHARRRSDGTWSSAVNVSHTVGRSSFQALARSDAGTLHVVWQDNTPGNYDVHYAGSSTYTVELPLVFGSCSVP